MASLPEEIKEREEYDRMVRWSLERESNASPGEVVMTFNYIRVKAVRIAMKIAQERGETTHSLEPCLRFLLPADVVTCSGEWRTLCRRCP